MRRVGFADAFGLAALEGVVDLPATQLQAADRAVAEQFAPARRRCRLLAHLRRLGPHIAAVLDQAEGNRHRMCGAHDDLVDHHHCHRGAAHRVDGNRLRVAGAADHHPLVGAHAVVPGAEGVQLLFRDADQQDRFVVFEDVGVADNRLRIEDHLQVDRLAGVGRDVGDAEGLEGVAEGFLALAQAAYAVVAFGVADPLDRGEYLGDAQALQLAEFGTLGGEADQQEHPGEDTPPRSGGKTKGAHRFHLLLATGEKRDAALRWGLRLAVESLPLPDARRSGGGTRLMKVKKWR